MLYLMLINLDYISYWKQALHIKLADLSKLMSAGTQEFSV